MDVSSPSYSGTGFISSHGDIGRFSLAGSGSGGNFYLFPDKCHLWSS